MLIAQCILVLLQLTTHTITFNTPLKRRAFYFHLSSSVLCRRTSFRTIRSAVNVKETTQKKNSSLGIFVVNATNFPNYMPYIYMYWKFSLYFWSVIFSTLFPATAMAFNRRLWKREAEAAVAATADSLLTTTIPQTNIFGHKQHSTFAPQGIVDDHCVRNLK